MAPALIIGLVILALAGSPASASPQAKAAEKPVLVVLVFDQTCKAWCEKVRPLMKELGQEFGEGVRFAELDATEAVLAETKKTAKDLGVLNIFKDVMDYVPVVLIFNRKQQLVKELTGPKSKDIYRNNIQKALTS